MIMVMIPVTTLELTHGASGIIHGDIKPENVLAFDENSRICPKVADSGLATCFQGHDEWVTLPKSEPWNAPEYHGRSMMPEEAQRMDIYSFGLMCFWLLFKAGSSGDALDPGTLLEPDSFVDFERPWSEKNLLQRWKTDPQDKIVEWVCWLVRKDQHIDIDIEKNLQRFFQSTLAYEPQSRSTDLAKLVGLLDPTRFDLPLLLYQAFLITSRELLEIERIRMSSAPEQESFEVTGSVQRFAMNANKRRSTPRLSSSTVRILDYVNSSSSTSKLLQAFQQAQSMDT